LEIVAYTNGGGSSHSFSPSVGCSHFEKDAPKVRRREAEYATMLTPWRSGVNREMNTKPEEHTNVTIEFRDVEYSVPTKAAPILAQISLKILPGEIVILLGRSGSGKTTILRLVNRLLKTTRGTVFVNECPVDSLDLLRLRR
jgi:ABC-type multidrug transport system fused ATPase/permease subunit